MLRVLESTIQEDHDGITEDDLLTLECIRKSEISYSDLFYLYDLLCPYGATNYDGSCFCE